MLIKGILWQNEKLLMDRGEKEMGRTEWLYQFTTYQQCSSSVNFENFSM